MENETEKINAVHERDLSNLLEKLGIAKQFEERGMLCKFCHTTVNKDNIYSVLPEKETASVICDKQECVVSLLEYINEKRKGGADQW